MRLRFAPISVMIGAFFTFGIHAAEWQPLFDGKTLDAFTQRGGEAKYHIEGNEIVGTSVPNTPNSFMCTKDYGDFVLEYEFKVHPALNSGVQIRSQSLPEYPRWSGSRLSGRNRSV